METENISAEGSAQPIGFNGALAHDVETEVFEPEAEAVETVEAAPEAPATEATPASDKTAGEAAPVEKKTAAEAGVLKAVQAERIRRQEAEHKNKELEARLAQYEGAPVAEELPPGAVTANAKVEGKLLAISETTARAAHPDYEEKFQAFAEIAMKNPRLYQDVLDSDHPGEAAYQAGRTVLFQKKYGADPETMAKKIREEVEVELEPKVRAKVEAELKGKIQAKNSQPKNILAGRAATGGEGEKGPVLGFKQLLARQRRR